MGMRRKQSEFLLKVAELIQWAFANGYELTLGDGYRDPRVFGYYGQKKSYGHYKSFHKRRLAIDLNLFIDGHYQMDSAVYEPLGLKWEELGGTWGGRFPTPDGNHFSWGEGRED